MVQEHNEPISKHLVDIKTIFIEKPMGFVLQFHFEPNEYFSNTILIKEYDMKCVPDVDDPFSFEGPCTQREGIQDEDFDDEEEEEDDKKDDEEDEDSDNTDNTKITNDKNCKQQ
ncbi:Nucleosome assembly protein (NAP) [Popillia japonica]|uniref:Nucleosome assembly protein (NAP) n=1 Tax=Popillia japonica TaxID=7064 RepID=A0AAW1HWB0_POPJA